MAQDFDIRLGALRNDSGMSTNIKLEECAQHIREYAGKSALAALATGGWLEMAHEIHKGVGREGQWSTWLMRNVSFVSLRTADRYRQVYRRFRDRKAVVSQFELSALYELCKDSTSAKAVAHALLEAEAGEFVTAKHAKQIVRTFSETPAKPSRKKTKPTAMKLPVAGGTVTVSIKGKDIVGALQDALAKLQQDATKDE